MSNVDSKTMKSQTNFSRDPNIVLEERISRFKKAFESQYRNQKSSERR